MKIVKCDYAAKKYFEVNITVLPFGCILLNKMHWKYSGTQNIWNSIIWRGMNDAKLIFVSPYFQFCLHTEVIMAAQFFFIVEEIKETLEWFQ